MTSNVVSPRQRDNGTGRQLSPEQAAAAAMVAEARQRGLELTGPNGLLKLFTKNVLETALNEEMTEHLGHEKHQAEEGLYVTFAWVMCCNPECHQSNPGDLGDGGKLRQYKQADHCGRSRQDAQHQRKRRSTNPPHR
jgi:hypothetical protein